MPVETLTLPRLGETMEQGRIVGWLKQVGETFERGETILEIETDKTVVELPALAAGHLIELLAGAGEEVAVGAPLARVETAVATPAPKASTAAASAPKPPPTQAAPTQAATVTDHGRVRATPAARRLARERQIPLVSLTGTGRRGRIGRHDVPARVCQGVEPAETPGKARFISVSQGRIAYAEWGRPGASRGTIVLLHGLAGDRQTWSGLGALLGRDGHHVLAPDLPGHGLTGIEAEGVEALVAPLAEFIAATASGPSELVAHSMAAVAAVRLAASTAGLRRLTLLGPAGLGPEIDGDFVAGVAAARTAGGLVHLLRRLTARPLALSESTVASLAGELAKGRLRRLAEDLVSGGRQQVDILADLEHLEVPTRVVFGLQDRIIPWPQVAHLPSRVAVHLIKEAGHMPQWDALPALARLFKEGEAE